MKNMTKEAPIAEAWQFNKIMPDWEDITACNLAWVGAENRISEGLDAGDIFNIAFFRGIAWERHRKEIEKRNKASGQ